MLRCRLECLLRRSIFALNASCGDVLAAIEDDPDCLRTELALLAPSRWSEIEAWWLLSTRHSSLIRIDVGQSREVFAGDPFDR